MSTVMVEAASQERAATLLGANDPPPFTVTNPTGRSPFLLLGDHAGKRIPAALGDLGLPAAERERHIAWDIGIAALGALLATALDAVFVHQAYSRLVVDCNRGEGAWDAIAPASDGTAVPGNAVLDESARARRFAEIHEPYQQAIGQEIDRRLAAGQGTILVSLHSFTPVMHGSARPWQVGILHDRGDTRFAEAMLAVLREERDLTVGDNAPYRMALIDYTVPRHAYPRALPYAEIEVRQDLLADAAGCAAWSDRLARALVAARARAGGSW